MFSAIFKTVFQSTPECLEHARQAFRGIGTRRQPSPDRGRPGRIVAIAHHMVDMQLGHDIAECGDIELVGMETLGQQGREPSYNFV